MVCRYFQYAYVGCRQVVQEIVTYLPDKDLGSFALVQRATRDAVLPPNAGHWRKRFQDQFHLPQGKTPAAIKADYTLRKQYFHYFVYFKLGHSKEENFCLMAIRQLFVGTLIGAWCPIILEATNIIFPVEVSSTYPRRVTHLLIENRIFLQFDCLCK